jgi:hypothetical protein
MPTSFFNHEHYSNLAKERVMTENKSRLKIREKKGNRVTPNQYSVITPKSLVMPYLPDPTLTLVWA